MSADSIPAHRRGKRRVPGYDSTSHWGWRSYALFRSGVLTMAAALGVVSIIAFGAALLFGIKPVVVISGSMEPTLPVGSVVFTRVVPVDDVSVGDIVTVERPRNLGLVTHRVVDIVDDGRVLGLELKGDANESVDPQPYDVATVGQYAGHVTHLGFVTLFFQSQHGLMAGVGIAATLVALFLFDPGRLAAREVTADERRPTMMSSSNLE